MYRRVKKKTHNTISVVIFELKMLYAYGVSRSSYLLYTFIHILFILVHIFKFYLVIQSLSTTRILFITHRLWFIIYHTKLVHIFKFYLVIQSL